jgi:hypothetical protein
MKAGVPRMAPVVLRFRRSLSARARPKSSVVGGEEVGGEFADLGVNGLVNLPGK